MPPWLLETTCMCGLSRQRSSMNPVMLSLLILGRRRAADSGRWVESAALSVVLPASHGPGQYGRKLDTPTRFSRLRSSLPRNGRCEG